MRTGDRTGATDSTSAGSGASDAGRVIGGSAEKDLKLSEDLAVSSEMAVSDTLTREMESLIMSEGLSCLEIEWLKEHRPDTLHKIRGETVGLEKIADSLGITAVWHQHFRAKLLRQWSDFYKENGTIALTQRWLTGNKLTRIYTSLNKHNMTMTEGIKMLGLTDELKNFKGPKTGQIVWSKVKFEETAKDIIKQFGCIPPAEFLDKHGFGSFRSYIGRFGPTIADVRKRHNVQNVILQSTDGLIWDSLPETSCANHLIARGIQVLKGKSYAKEYAEKYDRKSAMYDMHFRGTVEPFLNMMLSVEIFGSGNYGGDNIRKKHYAETRRFKEDFHKNDKTFITIEYKDCYSDARLSELLSPYIGYPDVVFGSTNRFNTTMDSLQEQVLQQCRDIKENLRIDKLPSANWFDRTGPYKDRVIHEWEPKSYAKLVCNIERMKFSEVRKLLGENNIPTHRKWNRDDIVLEYRDTVARHGVSPVTLYNRLKRLEKERGLSDDDKNVMSKMCKLSNAISWQFRGCRHLLTEQVNNTRDT